jgi:hypothetical protein
MSVDYSALSYGNAGDGYGQGAYGFGEGYQGSVFGGGGGEQMFPGGPGGGGLTGGQGGPTPLPILSGGMGPGEGVRAPSRRGAVGAPTSAQGGIKPLLSQLFGLSPQPQPAQRGRVGGRGPGERMQPPIMRSPITSFGPRPIQGRPILGQPGQGPIPVPRPGPGGPTPLPRGGTVAAPVRRPGPRRVGGVSG